MTAAHAPIPEPSDRVPMRELIHNTAKVIDKVEAGHSVQVTRHGRVVAVISPPNADELALDALAEAGRVAPDWRTRKQGLREVTRRLPGLTDPPGPPIGTEAVLADREDR